MFLLVLTISFISAVEIPTVSSDGFNFISWFKHTFNIQDFTIVGQDRHCDVYVRTGNTLYFDKGDLMEVDASDGGCNYALIDVFNGNWNEIGEWKNEFKAYCGGTNGCIVEIYCCPHPECSSDSQCRSWEGTGSECKRKYEVDPHMPLMDENHNIITSYKYCTAQCTGPDITCWRIEQGSCVSRTYNCGYETYPYCPTTWPYTSKSECEADLPECVSHDSFQCWDHDVYWYDSCGVREERKEECGTSGYTGSNYCYQGDVYKDYVTRDCYDSVCKSPTAKHLIEDCGTKTCLGGICVVVCQSNADSNNDGVISRSELGVYINKWISGTITRTKLGQAIQEWVDGC